MANVIFGAVTPPLSAAGNNVVFVRSGQSWCCDPTGGDLEEGHPSASVRPCRLFGKPSSDSELILAEPQIEDIQTYQGRHCRCFSANQVGAVKQKNRAAADC